MQVTVFVGCIISFAISSIAYAQEQREFCNAFKQAQQESPLQTISIFYDGNSDAASLMSSAKICSDLDRLAADKFKNKKMKLLAYAFRHSDYMNSYGTLYLASELEKGFITGDLAEHAVLRDALIRKSKSAINDLSSLPSEPQKVFEVAKACEFTFNTLIDNILADIKNEDEDFDTRLGRLRNIFVVDRQNSVPSPVAIQERMEAYSYALQRFSPKVYDSEIDRISFSDRILEKCEELEKEDSFGREYKPSQKIILDCLRFGELIKKVVFGTRHFWISESGGRYGGLDKEFYRSAGIGDDKISNPPIKDANCKVVWKEQKEDYWLVTLQCWATTPMPNRDKASLTELLTKTGAKVNACLRDHYNNRLYGNIQLNDIRNSANFSDLKGEGWDGSSIVDLADIEDQSTDSGSNIYFRKTWGKNSLDNFRMLSIRASEVESTMYGFLELNFSFLEKTPSLGPSGMPVSP